MISAWFQAGTALNGGLTKDWFSDALIAYDSKNYLPVAGAFTDYKGNLMQTGAKASGVGTLAPSTATETGLEYGGGIKLPYGSWITTATGSKPGTVFSQDFTLDFWYKQDLNSTPMPLYLVTGYPDTVAGFSYANRLLIGQGTGEAGNGPVANISVWNNNQNPRTWSSWAHGFATSTWKHIAVTYNATTKILTFFRDGTLLGTINYDMQPVVGNVQLGVATISANGTGYIERYRLRTGVKFPGSGFALSTIYS